MDQYTKTCKGCGEVKSLELFSRHPHTKDGRSTSCKACDSARLKARAERIKAQEKLAPAQKHCPKCGETKHSDQFGKNRANEDGLNYHCKACVNAAAAARWASNPEYARRNAERNRELYADQPRYLNYRYKGRFGITLSEYEQMLEAQGGGCAICLERPDPDKPRFPVDHDHACCPGKKSCGGCVRGILCPACNHGLGKFKDKQDLLKSAISYLQK